MDRMLRKRCGGSLVPAGAWTSSRPCTTRHTGGFVNRTARSHAIELRRTGATYRELMGQFGVAKSTLWRWLKAEGLVETHPQKLTELKRAAQQRGAAVVRARRIERVARVLDEARKQVGQISDRELWLIGIALYWAEGAKQKPNDVSCGVLFSNSDVFAVQVFVEWLRRCCNIPPDLLTYDIYLHISADGPTTRAFWASELNLPATAKLNLYWKRHRPQTNRYNTGSSYHGVMRVRVPRSTELNRRIQGWVAGVAEALGSGLTVCHGALDPANPGSTPGSPAISSDEPLLQDAAACRFWEIGHTDVNRLFGGSMCHERQGRYA